MDPNTHRFLHVANGTSTTDTIHAAGIPGSTSIWADPLHEGPVPARLTDEELLDVRAGHLAGNDRSGIAFAETIAELRRWREAIDDRASYDELVLWYEHDLFDQLNLIQLLARIGQEPAVDHRRVSLICIDRFPGHPRFKGLGELSALELGSLLETRQPVSADQYELAARAWDAFRADDPLALDRLLGTDTSALAVSCILAAASPRGVSVDARRAVENRASDHAARTPRLDRHPEGISADARRRVGVLHRGLVVLADREGTGVSDTCAGLDCRDRGGARPIAERHDCADRHRAVDPRRSRRPRRAVWHRPLAGGVHLVDSQPNWRWDSGRQTITQF